MHGCSRYTGGRELRGHEPGVLNVFVVVVGVVSVYVADPASDLGEHQAGAGVIAGIEVGELRLIVARARPADPSQVRGVGDAEVLEGHQKLLVERLPEAQFVGDVSVEVGQQRLAVASFGGGRQADQYVRAQAQHDRLV